METTHLQPAPSVLTEFFSVHAAAPLPSVDVPASQLEKVLRENERLAVLGRLAASIAHEINNPLESVTNLLYLLQTEPGLPETASRHIALARQELHRVSTISGNTLKFLRHSAWPAETQMEEVLESVLTLYQGRIRHSGVRIRQRLRAHAAFLGFAAELRQVVANFLGNALDATPANGTVELRLRPSSSGRDGNTGILLTIADTGTGISAETITRLYQAFFTTRVATGTGLGLWMSMELIQKHRGWVKVRSRQTSAGRTSAGGTSGVAARETTGTVFQIFLPYDNGLGAERRPAFRQG